MAAVGQIPRSSWLYLLAFVAVLAGALLPNPLIDMTTNMAIAAFLMLEFRHAPLIPRLIGSILIAIGLAAAISADAVTESLWRGIGDTQKFLVLFGAVAWLQVPASESPSLGAIRRMVMSQPAGRRFAYLGAAAHGLGVAFNLAGISLLSGMVTRQDDRNLRRRLGRAMVQGFSTSSCWSPLFVGAAVILAAWPMVSWFEVAPYGIALAIALIFISWLLDRLSKRGAGRTATPATPESVPLPAWAKTAFVLSILFAGVLALVEFHGVSIPIALGIVAPPLALIWRIRMAVPGGRVAHGRELGRRVVFGLADLRGEILVFAGANFLGAGIAAAVDPAVVASVLDNLNLTTDAKILVLSLGFVVCGLFAIHPVIMVVLISRLLPPEILGISPQVLVMMLMALWGMSTNVSPVSGTVLYIARLTGETSLTIAWRWNPPFAFCGALLVAGLAIPTRDWVHEERRVLRSRRYAERPQSRHHRLHSICP